MNIVTVIPISAADTDRAESLLDWIRALNANAQHGHVLLSYAKDVHGESQAKIRIAAELAFSDVAEFRPQTDSSKGTEPIRANLLFRDTAQHVASGYRWPWLCLHPGCVPLRDSWLADLTDAYEAQPKRYLGPFLKTATGDAVALILGRTSIYPASAYLELKDYFGSPHPFEFATGPMLPRATATKLVQHGAWQESDSVDRIRSDACVFDGDRTGKLMELLKHSEFVYHTNCAKWEPNPEWLKATHDIEFPNGNAIQMSGTESPRIGSYVSAFEEPIASKNGHDLTVEYLNKMADSLDLNVNTLAESVSKTNYRVKDAAVQWGVDESKIKELIAQSNGRIFVGRGAWLKVKN